MAKRKDISRPCLTTTIKAFMDPFPDSEENVRMEDRKLDPRRKLRFAELYIKIIAHSSKCTKVLKDRLLHEMNMSMTTSMIQAIRCLCHLFWLFLRYHLTQLLKKPCSFIWSTEFVIQLLPSLVDHLHLLDSHEECDVFFDSSSFAWGFVFLQTSSYRSGQFAPIHDNEVYAVVNAYQRFS